MEQVVGLIQEYLDMKKFTRINAKLFVCHSVFCYLCLIMKKTVSFILMAMLSLSLSAAKVVTSASLKLVAVMYAGKICEYGTDKEIFFDPRHPYTWALLASIPDIVDSAFHARDDLDFLVWMLLEMHPAQCPALLVE